VSGRVVIIGFGVTGRAVARYARAHGDDVTVYDDSPSADLVAAANALGVAVETTPPPGDLAKCLAGVSLVVPSPGVPVSHPVFAEAAQAGVPVVSEIELASRLRAAAGPQLVAITGTNGKTTVTTLVTAMLQASGISAVAAGNIGVPLVEAVTSAAEVCVAEVSSFQLQFTETFRPAVSCWLNLSPDHLDWHPTIGHYAGAKSRIWRNQEPGDTAVINADDALVVASASSIPKGVRVIGFSVSRDAPYTYDGVMLRGPGGEEIMAAQELPRALPHDVANALAAAAVASAAGATADGCRSALKGAPLLPHRVSLVGSGRGVDWYDDSKATTPASVLAAVAGLESVVLIAGGRNKGLDLGVLASGVPPVRAVVAIGEAAGEVTEAFRGLVPVQAAQTMEEAVSLAASLSSAGDSVLLSPGCASFDWYGSYAERGDHFVSLVKSLLSKGES
jgi:UDP-N-acetylmuramoylalanine--D-glutamate ligase